jgi:proline iminopeptidase
LNIPGTLVHGRLDVSGPLEGPWRLHEAWPGSDLVVVDDAGHGGASMWEVIRTVRRELG